MKKDVTDKKPLIFIVDDDEDDRYFIKSAILNNISHSDIELFKNGKELIDHLQKTKNTLPSFILLDLNMPVLNGKETLKLIRKNETMVNLPVIIFSTSNRTCEKSLCFEYGATDYFCKPACVEDYNNIARKLNLEYIKKDSVGMA